MRSFNRKSEQLRPIKITRSYLKSPAGSVLIEMGDTKVICCATIEEKVPNFKKDSNEGWVTAEYALLPASTSSRTHREHSPRGRSQEIQRLIGRSLRAVVDLSLLGERTIICDADVIQADGGTRCASICGCFVALYDAVKKLLKDKKIEKNPIKHFLAAVSVGLVEKKVLLDLDYSEDFKAEVDMNVVMNDKGDFIEIQGTGEKTTFSQAQLNSLLKAASKGIRQIIQAQKKAVTR